MGIARRGVLKELEVCDFDKNEMMAVAVNIFQNFRWSRFLIIRPNVNMATNAILYTGLTPGAQHQDHRPARREGDSRILPVYLH